MVKPSKKALGKRKAPPAPAKGAKNSKAEAPEKGPTGKPKRKPEQPKKVKQRDQKFLPVPKTVFGQNGDDSDDMDEDDLGVEEGMDFAQAGFLKGLDRNALSRTVKENQRIHNLEKTREPLPKVQRKKELLRLPSPSSSHSSDYDFDSDVELSTDAGSDIDLGGSDLGDDDDADDLGSEDDEDDEAEGSGSTSTLDGDSFNEAYDEIDDDDLDLDENDDGQVHEQRKRKRKEEEADYEVSARTKWSGPKAKQEAEDSVEVGRLPIKLPNGVVQSVEGTTRIELPPSKKRAAKPEPEESDIEEEEEDEFEGEDDRAQAEKMAGQKGKFGRMGIAEIVYHEGWKNAQKLEAAKEQIAQIGAEILAGGELIDIGPVLTRMSTFALPTVPSPEDDKLKMPVPNSIRGLTLLSQLAVFKDLIPGYRIRQLTAMEEQEKVRDDVRRQREGEKLLVRSYKGYLKTLESETKRRTPLASISIRCMCDLLTSVTHFNYSENIMGVLVGRVARRSWDEECELVLQSFVSVFKQDITATNSQILVRLINRMIKERKFQVHPNVLTCLLHLRLRTELDSMKRGKNSKGKGKRPDGDKPEKQFKSDVRKKWQTKNQKKREREMKEVQKEMAEAEAEVDQEERAQVQTETLKNLFVLYFSILKHPGRSPLLPTALEGISQFAHFINVDFFRDLLAVLRRIIVDQKLEAETVRTEAEEEEEDKYEDPVGSSEKCRIRLLAIVTAFDLLTGQGEAINIDLGDFVASLYAILRPLSLDTGFEDPPLITTQAARFNHNQKQVNKPLQKGKLPPKQAIQNLTTSDLLFRCLHSIFFTKYQAAAGKSPTWRMAAFAKRLTECAMFFPPISAQKAVQFARSLVAKEPKLESMLDTEERTFDGVYKPELDDPQLCNPFATSLWEVDDLATRHWDRQVRGEAAKLRDNAAF